MKLRCIIVDDEPLAAELLKKYVLQTPFLELVDVHNNPIEALTNISDKNIDIAFLDINMPQINGIDLSKNIPKNIKVIFTTAYDQYALDGFKVNALDYLLKPINYNDFLQAANKALDWYKRSDAPIRSNCIFVKSGYRVEKIEYEHILYIENQKDYVKFYLDNEAESVSSLMNIQQLSEKLPDSLFMRVHRSFIVNLDKIKSVERNCIVFGKVYIPISDSYKSIFNDFMKSKMI